MSADVDDNLRIIFLKEGKIPTCKDVYSGILEPDRIHHSGRGLDNARRRISGPWAVRNSLGNYSAERGKINELPVLHAGPECPGSGHDRVFKGDSRKCYFCMSHVRSTSSARKTGPSLHILVLWTCECPSIPVVLHTQARHAPIPQAMRSSMET